MEEKKNKYTYDPSGNQAYNDAVSRYEEAKQQEKPTYAGTYDDKLNSLYDQLMNRPNFSYNLNGDALYKQYRDSYARQGRLAMMDTMGQASALTGGFGSTYGQAVGQQTYDGYLQQLTDRVPELQQMALSRYNAEGEQLSDQYTTTKDLADAERGAYNDALDRYLKNLADLENAVESAYSNGYAEWYKSLQLEREDAANAERQQKAAYDKLVQLMKDTGYRPTDEELAAAGMSAGVRDAYLNRFTAAMSRSGGGGRRSKKKKEEQEKAPKVPGRLLKQLNNMVSSGESRGRVNSVINESYHAGSINKEQYDYLKQVYTGRGVMY